MLLEVGTQERGVELGLEAEVVLDDNRLHIGIHHDAKHAFFKTRHRDRLIHKRVFGTTKLPQFNTSLAYLFRSGIIADNQHLKVRFGKIALVKIILEQTIIPFRLAFFTQLPCIHGTTVGAGNECLRDPFGDSRETGIVTPAQCILQRTHHYFPRISAEGLDNAERCEKSFHGAERFRGGSAGGGLRDKGLARVGQFLPAITASLASAKHTDGITGRGLGCFWRWSGHSCGVIGCLVTLVCARKRTNDSSSTSTRVGRAKKIIEVCRFGLWCFHRFYSFHFTSELKALKNMRLFIQSLTQFWTAAFGASIRPWSHDCPHT